MWRDFAVAVVMAGSAAMTLSSGAQAQMQTEAIESQVHKFEAVVLAGGLKNPWGMAFLPDGRMLITERPGRLRIFEVGKGLSAPLSGVPEVAARGQGGLLDVVLHPDHGANGWIYMSYAIPQEGGARTAVSRARLDGEALVDLETIFVARNPGSGDVHFGSRLGRQALCERR